MREPLKDRIRLVHIQDAINNINQYIDGKTLQELNSNFLVHDYYRIDYKEVWKVIHEDLPPLREQVTHYLAETNWDEWEKNEVAISESATHKTLMQTATRMKSRGYDVDEICKITGLNRDEIDWL